jgi:superfamily II DNA/RNA helicase
MKIIYKNCCWCFDWWYEEKIGKNRIRKGLNILVATPGRLCNHLDTTMALDLASFLMKLIG